MKSIILKACESLLSSVEMDIVDEAGIPVVVSDGKHLAGLEIDKSFESLMAVKQDLVLVSFGGSGDDESGTDAVLELDSIKLGGASKIITMDLTGPVGLLLLQLDSNVQEIPWKALKFSDSNGWEHSLIVWKDGMLEYEVSRLCHGTSLGVDDDGGYAAGPAVLHFGKEQLLLEGRVLDCVQLRNGAEEALEAENVRLLVLDRDNGNAFSEDVDCTGNAKLIGTAGREEAKYLLFAVTLYDMIFVRDEDGINFQLHILEGEEISTVRIIDEACIWNAVWNVNEELEFSKGAHLVGVEGGELVVLDEYGSPVEPLHCYSNGMDDAIIGHSELALLYSERSQMKPAGYQTDENLDVMAINAAEQCQSTELLVVEVTGHKDVLTLSMGPGRGLIGIKGLTAGSPQIVAPVEF